MDKILIILFVPAINESFDLFVPTTLAIRSLTTVITKAIVSLSSGRYVPSGLELLSLREPDALLDPRKTLKDYSVPYGADMMLL